MTILSKILYVFPTLILLLVFSNLFWLIINPSFLPLFTLFICLYIIPLLVYRIHQYFYPNLEGISYLKGKEYNPWWGTQQIQIIYNSFSFLEKILHLVPGLFSLWLRLWGAKIGKNVYWVPTVSILDRPLIEVGDGVIIGHHTVFCSHNVKPKKDNLIVFTKKIKVGNYAFISGDVGLAPGVEIEDKAFVPYGEKLYPRVKLKANKTENDNSLSTQVKEN
ncbi:acyltransferase [Cyanobacterium aponinum]|uniref:Acyl transferase n=1 Tax=Cyanobacterium aponinum (strain PCC 10605) TaxID=755178 RepID=K9Z1K8_CYAAP|nr:hypothetical protein [Cyanobacterium aponinum]AFZ53049.1 hypothetical protein Cyan10605_0919 [Cyanobacterium aponinum PCC 10605]